MRHWTVLLLVVALACPARAQQSEVHIGWDDSPTHGGARNFIFPCATNTASATFVVSFTPGFDLLGVTDITATIVVGAGALGCDMGLGPCIGSAPDYWRLEPGGCREGALAASSYFGLAQWDTSTTVLDPWMQTMVAWRCTLEDSTYWHTTPEQIEIEVMPVNGAVDLHAGREYYVARGTVAQTPRSPRCAGCCTSAVLAISSIAVKVPSAGTPYVFAGGADDAIGWQNGSPACLDTPTRRSSWGALKATYR